jgi:hypothetical protein
VEEEAKGAYKLLKGQAPRKVWNHHSDHLINYDLKYNEGRKHEIE